MTNIPDFLPAAGRRADWCLSGTNARPRARLSRGGRPVYTGRLHTVSTYKESIMFLPVRLRSLVLAAAAAGAVPAHAAAPDPVVTALMSKALPEMPGKEVLMLTVDYAPGAADPVHRHDAHGFIYVLEGTIVMGVAGGREHTLHAGETFYEGPRDVHTVGRNASRTKPARFLVFLLKDKDKPALIPVGHP
jgi:quercetin dioxygenase-like cupin family protein